MEQRLSGARLGHGSPANLVIANSADATNRGATQHRPTHRAQSACRTRSGVARSSRGRMDSMGTNLRRDARG
jgi:hypothetical protein